MKLQRGRMREKIIQKLFPIKFFTNLNLSVVSINRRENRIEYLAVARHVILLSNSRQTWVLQTGNVP